MSNIPLFSCNRWLAVLLLTLFHLSWAEPPRLFGQFSSKQEKPRPNEKILKLRKQLENKFVLDYLLRYVPKNIEDIHIDSSLNRSTQKARYRLIERFVLGDVYSVFVSLSLSGDKQYILVSDSAGGATGDLFLFSKESTHSHFLDSYDFSSHGGSFEFDTLPGLSLIRGRRPSWGTGYYLIDESYLGIINDKFKILFSSRRLELTASEDTLYTITTRKLTFVDLNNDGFKDIVENEVIERIQMPEFQEIYSGIIKGNILDEMHDSDSTEVIWQHENNYYWNKELHCFEKRQ